MEVRILKDYELPLDEPVNYYIIPEMRVMIDAGIKPPRDGYDYVYITHWHWDHTLGLAEITGKTICMHEKTMKTLRTRKYSERFLTVMRAGGIKVSREEEALLRVMDERIAKAAKALDKNDVVPLEECPHVRNGTIKYIECPGHSVDHVCYLVGPYIFVGDTLLPTRRTTILDFRRHRESIIEVLSTQWSTLYPGHGSPLTRREAGEVAKSYVVGRCTRTYQVLRVLANRGGRATLADIAREIYGVMPGLASFVAFRTLIGYIAELEEQGVVRVDRGSSPWIVEIA